MLLHFMVPMIILAMNVVRLTIADEQQGPYIKKAMIGIYIPFALAYALISLQMLRKRLKEIKSDIAAIKKQNQVLKKWSIILMSLFILIAVKITLYVIIHQIDYSIKDNNEVLWSGAIHWMIIYATFLLNPDILYGYNALGKKLNDQSSHGLAKSDLWIMEYDHESITNQKDQKLFEKITRELIGYIDKIEKISFHSDFFRNPDLSLEDLSEKTNIPMSHLYFIFKYHSSVSFSDFKKIVRIQDSIKVLRSGYLKNNTIEALALKVGFSSYTPFYISFKNITSLTPMEYYKSIT